MELELGASNITLYYYLKITHGAYQPSEMYFTGKVYQMATEIC